MHYRFLLENWAAARMFLSRLEVKYPEQPLLSPIESRILNLVSEGKSRAKIEPIVKSTAVWDYYQLIKNKLNSRTMAEAVRRGIELGIIPIVLDKDGTAVNLTTKEIQILQLASEGLRIEEVAERLNIGRSTLTRWRYRMFRKLGATNVNHAVRRAFELGIFKSAGSSQS